MRIARKIHVRELKKDQFVEFLNEISKQIFTFFHLFWCVRKIKLCHNSPKQIERKRFVSFAFAKLYLLREKIPLT